MPLKATMGRQTDESSMSGWKTLYDGYAVARQTALASLASLRLNRCLAPARMAEMCFSHLYSWERGGVQPPGPLEAGLEVGWVMADVGDAADDLPAGM